MSDWWFYTPLLPPSPMENLQMIGYLSLFLDCLFLFTLWGGKENALVWESGASVLIPALPLISSMTLSNSFYPVDLRVPILEMQRVAGIISGWLMGFSISIIPKGLYWHLLGQKLYPPSWEWHQQTSSVSLLLKAIWRLDLQWEQTAGFPLLTVWNVNKLILPWPLLSASSSEHHCPLLPIILIKWNELKWTSVYLIDLVYQNHNQPATEDNCD